MATDPGSNNLDDFDIEQVINWDEHNYASKNLEFQQLPDLDLPTDVTASAPTAVATTPTTVTHSAGMMMRTQVLGGTHQQRQDQGTNILSMSQATRTSVMNPVFPQDASCIIADIRQELGSSSSASRSRATISPTFPSENFDLPPLTHPHHMVRPSAPNTMNFMPRHANQVSGAPQMVHNMTQHRAMHSRMQGYNQSMPVDQSLPAGMGDDADDGSIDKLIEDIVDRDLPQGVGDPIVFHQESHPMSMGTPHVAQQLPRVIQRSSSPSQMPQMVHSPVTSQTMSLGSPMGSTQSRGGGAPLHNPNPLAGSPLGQKPGSPLAGSQAPSPKMTQGSNMPLKLQSQQKPSSPQMPIGMVPAQVQSPRPSPQNTGVGMGSGPVHSPRPISQNASMAMSPGSLQNPRQVPQNCAMGMTSGPVHSPRPISQNVTMSPGALQNARQAPQNSAMGMTSGPIHSPRSVLQRSPQHMANVLSPSLPQSSVAQSVPSPLSQMSPLKMPPTPPMGSSQAMGMPQSPVKSPMSIPSPQTSRPQQQPSPQMQRPSPQPSPGLRNMGSPGNQVISKGKDVARMQAQAGITSASQGNVAAQSALSCKPQQVLHTVTTAQSTPVQAPRMPASVMPVSGGKPMQKLISTMQMKNSPKSKPAQGKTTAAKLANTGLKNSNHSQSITGAQTQVTTTSGLQSSTSHLMQTTKVQVSGNTSQVTTSTINTATAQNILKGISSLKGTNLLPLTLKQGGNQPLQAFQLPGNTANANLIKQAMLLKAIGSSGTGQTMTPGQPMSVSTSQGQVFYYVLPKGTNTGAVSNASVTNAAGQSLKMIVINAKTPVNVNKHIAPPVDAAASVPLTQTLTSGGVSIQPVGIGAPLYISQVCKPPFTASMSQVKSVGNNNIVMSTQPMSTMSNGSTIMSTGQENDSFSINTGFPQQSSSIPFNIGGPPSSNTSQVPGMLVAPVSSPSNPATVGHIQTAGTACITFINESSGVGQFVASSGQSNNYGGGIKSQFLNHSSMADTPKVVPQKAQDDSDSDTPLAEVAETLKKNGDEKKKKKKKKGEKRKKKDRVLAELPKPLSAYQLFFKETQAAIRQQNTSAQFGEIAKIVGQMWENLPEDQKKVYIGKHDKEKAEYQKAVRELKLQQDVPEAKVLKVEDSTSPSTLSKIPSSKFYGSAATAKEPVKEGVKAEAIRIKIPKTAVSAAEKLEGVAPSKPGRPSSMPSGPVKTPSSNNIPSTAQPLKKKSKTAINPISQRICIRDGCNMPARTTKERGTQYCSNDCTVQHCRIVFNSWIAQRKAEVL